MIKIVGVKLRKMNVASLPHTRMHARIRKAIDTKSDATVSKAEVTCTDPPVIQSVPRPKTQSPPEPPNRQPMDSSKEWGPKMNLEEHSLNHALSVGYTMAN